MWWLIVVAVNLYPLWFILLNIYFFRALKNASHPVNPPIPDTPNISLASAITLFSGGEDDGERYVHC